MKKERYRGLIGINKKNNTANYDIVVLYVCIDDFSKIYEEWGTKKLIGITKCRKREGKLSMSEQLLIVILYQPWGV